MAKILFLQDAFFEYNGIQSLSAYAKAKGHQVELLVCEDREKDAIYAQVSKADPQLKRVISDVFSDADEKVFLACSAGGKQKLRLSETMKSGQTIRRGMLI